MDLALRAALAALLLAAALGKARDPGGAAERLAEHGVPLVEAGLGVALAAGSGTRWVAAAAAALLALFALAFLRRRLRGVRRAPCGCLGRTRERSTLAVAGRAPAHATPGVHT